MTKMHFLPQNPEKISRTVPCIALCSVLYYAGRILFMNIDHPVCQAYQRLFRFFGPQHWWPCRSGRRWEIAAGAILTQNCAWTNVEKALDQLETAGFTTPETVLAAPDEILQTAIRPAGFFRQKSQYLREMARFFRENEDRWLHSSAPVRELRRELLSVKGCGRETADSILLYAFQRPVFIIDAYTRRFSARHLGLDGTLPYDELQRVFMEILPQDTRIYNEYHALIVQLCKVSCLKSGCGEFCRIQLSNLTASR